MVESALKPIFFASPAAFRKWLQKNHQNKKEVLAGYYKVGTGKPSMTWSESVDQALCFGWIDGIRKSIDDESYCIRFTPRKPDSIWSAVNIRKVKELSGKGLMEKAGLEAFQKRKAEKSKIYSFEREEAKLAPEFEKRLKGNKKAWQYFQALAPSYQKTSIYWVMSAKQQATREKRLAQLISESAKGTNQWKDNKYAKKR